MSTIKNGTVRIKIEAWDEINHLTKYFAEDLGFIFRGQSDSSWVLEPTLNRYIKKVNAKLRNDSIYSYHLENFTKSLRGKKINFKELTNNELWALGQHYGLYSPLLDFTFSFFIAIYFAFIEDCKPISGYRKIYALHLKGIKDKMELYNQEKTEMKKFEIVESMSHENPRIINQAGLFLKIPLDFCVEDWFRKQLNDENRAYYFEIEINNENRLRILKELDLMNINPKTIYPDIYGATENCNHQLMLMSDKFEKQNKSTVTNTPFTA